MWETIWLDTDKIVEQRTIEDNVVEQRITWINPAAVDYRPEPFLIRVEPDTF